MRVMLFAAAVLLASPAAFAQTADRSAGTQAFVNMCVARAQGTTQPEPHARAAPVSSPAA